MRALLFLPIFCLACTGTDATPRLGGAHATKPATGRDDRATNSAVDTVDISGPTLLTTFVSTQAQGDSNTEVNEALADYQFYLERTLRVLERYHITVEPRSDSLLVWRDRLGVHSYIATDRSGGIAYLFLMPTGARTILHEGVMTDLDLLHAAEKSFGERLLSKDTLTP
jgi:hypothetical protein